jgi:histidinol phosphatase-like enzyme
MAIMMEKLSSHRVVIRDIMVCPHTKEECCSCRKPEPGMLYFLARQNDICLKDSYMIGDSSTDMEAGYRAGLPHRLKIDVEMEENYYIHSGTNEYAKGMVECKSFLLAAQWVVENERRRNG